jgi:hypothetical protein
MYDTHEKTPNYTGDITLGTPSLMTRHPGPPTLLTKFAPKKKAVHISSSFPHATQLMFH